MRMLRLAFCLLSVVPLSGAEAVLPGHVFFQTDFEGVGALSGWPPASQLTAGRSGGHALVVERPAGSVQGSATLHHVLPVEQMRGCRVAFSAWIKAEKISAPPQPWNGVKFMALVQTPGGTQWPAAHIEAGTFDWKRVTFSVRVPDDAQSLSLIVGLESVTGKVWFDDICVWLLKMPIVRPKQAVAGVAYRGHDLPRLRGAMVGPKIDAKGLRTFGRQWHANVIRWQLIRPGRSVKDPLDLAAYDAWLRTEFDKLDAVLPVCWQAGLRVVVDLHSPPGGRVCSGGYAAADAGLFNNADCQVKFVEVWRNIARRYKNAEAVWGYDLVNEPDDNSVEEGLADWQQLAERAARAVREFDARHAIIVEPASGGGPEGFAELRPIDVPRVVYSFHMYQPVAFTHQGIFGSTQPVRYPGLIDGRQWDKARLERAMKPAIDFQKTYGVHLYVGEFSAIRWAPDDSACRYLKDLIEIFETHGWDWTYHAFREWDGWSVEHGSDRDDHALSPTPTTRQVLLRGWYSQNHQP
jgi:hypothetical protein